MGLETKELLSATDNALNDEPIFGYKPNKVKLPFPAECEYKYFVGCISDELARLELENIMTTSYRCQGYLKKPGDICVISETGSFDKEGCYNVVVKYIIFPGKE